MDSDSPEPASPTHPARLISIQATSSDVASMNTLLRTGVRVGNEDVDRDVHLHDLVRKPWGQEYRAYADDFLDVWHLQIDPGQSTSMHAHPRKTTYLLCLDGRGVLDTLGGAHHFGAGSVLRIGRGAFHSTTNVGTSPLMVVEVETPRNKFDLVRLRDSYNRVGTAYEKTTIRLVTAPRKVPYLPNARMCRVSPCGAFAFEIVAGMDVHYRRQSVGAFLIPLSLEALVADHMEILTDAAADLRRPDLSTYYLAVRSLVRAVA